MTDLLIAHNAYIHPGGEDACVDRESRALREAGLDVEMFQCQNTSTAQTATDALAAPFGGGEEKRLESLLDAERPKILHVHNLAPLLSPRVFKKARTLGIRTVQTLHNFRPLCLNGLFRTPAGENCERCAGSTYWHGVWRGCYRTSPIQSAVLAAHLAAQREAYKSVDTFIAPSRFLRERYVHYRFPDERLIVQPHFVEAFPDPTLPEDPPYVLYLGRLSEEKGVPFLLDAFRSPPARIRLLIAGDGPLREHVCRAEGTTVQWRGVLQGPEKLEVLRKASALVLASTCYENFPLAVVEANAAGTPALVRNLGGMAELVQTGRNGRTFESTVQDFWSNLLLLVQQFKSLDARQACRRDAMTQFSKPAFLARRLDLYRKLGLGSPPGAPVARPS